MADVRILAYSVQMAQGKGFFTLKLEGESSWTKWAQVTPAEITAIVQILNSGAAMYDLDHGIFKLPPQGRGLHELHGDKAENLPSLEITQDTYPLRKP